MKLKSVAVGVLALLCSAVAYAKDYGVQGNTWPIIEIDVRKLMVESASRVDWTKVQDHLKDSGKNYVEDLPKRHLSVIGETKTTWYDPSITLSSDIRAPVEQASGQYKWQVLYPAGTKVNPLTKFRPLTAMLLFDGSNAHQLELVKEVLKLEPNRIVPVEAGAGDLGKEAKELGRPVFYASDTMMTKYPVKYLPSLMYAGNGAHSLYIGVTAFAEPFNANLVLSTWGEPGVGQTPMTQKAHP